MNRKLHQEYEKDFYAWIVANATLLKQRKFAELDIDNLVEEIESMGRGEKRQLMSRLELLLAHMLKWKFQPNYRGKSWKCTIDEQRRKFASLLKESPSLKYELEARIEEAYEDAKIAAEKQMRIERKAFPRECPFTLDQCLDETFYPE